ncbi:MAG TPA: hypothetical protein VFC03_08940, partial [Acidimicrobiales bacterium]|nr:hypothetical protein [Acidimicrobiales bacterium]
SVEKHVSTIFRKLGLIDQALVDRRVTAALIFLRAQTDPFGLQVRAALDQRTAERIVVPWDVDELLAELPESHHVGASRERPRHKSPRQTPTAADADRRGR